MDEKKLIQIARAIDPWYWTYSNKMNLGGHQYSLKGHEYQLAWFQDPARAQCYRKGAQLGCTEVGILRTLHGMVTGKYPQGVLYLFPTRDDVTDFSKARFAPLIDTNVSIKAMVQETDAANIKRIGGGTLYLRGARARDRLAGVKATSSALKSIPVDRVVFDEVDEMDPAMVDLALERMSHSLIKEEVYLSTPSIPDYGVDALYQKSDQRVWMVKCEACFARTCLELEFPECLKRREDGSVFRACKKCGEEIHPRKGEWVPQYPDRSKDLVGWWISQLNSIFVDPKAILDAWEDPQTNIAEFYNSKLGMAYIAAENRLVPNDLWATCGEDAARSSHPGPTAMGVDVGKVLHVVIADRPNDKMLRVVKCARVSNFSDVYDLAKAFGVKAAVIDMEPETRKVRDFQARMPFTVFLADYSEHQRGAPKWDYVNNQVVVNRTEVCDATHDLVIKKGMLSLPRRNEEIDEYIRQMCSIAKVKQEDEVSGSIRYVYRKLGADHYRHATNYLWLASQQVGLSREGSFLGRWRKNRKAPSPIGWT